MAHGADVEFTPDMGVSEGRSSHSVGHAVTVAGAVLSLAFMTGIGIWGYKLMMRDVSGVPVVRAIEGPMRVQPEDPGGRPADHQGLAVNAVAAVGEAEATPDRLVLAPRPVSLKDEDQPLAVIQAEPEEDPADAPVADETADAATPAETDDSAPAELLDENAIAALVEQLTEGVDPLEGLTGAGESLTAMAPDVDWPEVPVEDPAAVAAAEAEAAAAAEAAQTDLAAAEVAAAPGVKASPRPVPRPLTATAEAVSAQISAATDTSAPAVEEADPETLTSGTRLAQLGAYDSPEVARSEWDKLATRFSDYLDGKSRVVQKAASGGRTFYRLRAMGFEDLSDARRFCSALVAEGTDCIPVVTR
ncbi:MAG: SPOR domain-containing protein [Pseudomonadota bacterium]